MNIRVLVVCAGSKENFIFEIDQVFVNEQITAIKKHKPQVEFDLFLVKESGFKGYLKAYFELRTLCDKSNYDIIHAHFGLSGLIAGLQRNIKKVITFHGTDINNSKKNLFSTLSGSLSDHNIFVSKQLKDKALFSTKAASIVPCGIDIESFDIVNKKVAKKKLNLNLDQPYILFCSSADRKVKNYSLAKAAVELLSSEINLIELKGYNREEVKLLLNACDVLLMTSFNEGSPQIIKEGMACGIPIVSTDVGEVKNIIGNTKGCWLVEYDAEDVAEKLKKALQLKNKTEGRKQIMNYDNKIIAEQVYEIYREVFSK